MSEISKEFTLSPITVLLPKEGELSSLALSLPLFKERLENISRILESSTEIEEQSKRSLLLEKEMLAITLKWMGI